jgi:RND family efflux transporter MFP subunit
VQPGAPPSEAALEREVRTARAVEVVWPRSVAAVGTLAAHEESTLGSEVAGRLAEMRVDIGSVVRTGEVLARVDPGDFELRVRQAQAALEQARAALGLDPGSPDQAPSEERAAFVQQAKAELAEARASYERVAPLREQGVVSPAEFDAAQAGFHVAEARYAGALQQFASRRAQLAQLETELEIARDELADTALVAPYDGTVVERIAGVGDYLEEGSEVLVLARVDRLRLEAAVPERVAAAVRPGQTLHIRVDDVDEERTSQVARVSPRIRPEDRTLIIEADIDNPPRDDGEHPLVAGSFARVEIEVDAEARALVVPAAALVTFAGIDKVFALEDGVAVERRITAGRVDAQRVEVLQGLVPGAEVVLEPGNLRSGERVRSSAPEPGG